MDREDRPLDGSLGRSQERINEISELYRKSHLKNSFRDALSSLRRARPYRFWKTCLAYFRRFRMISYIIRVIGYLFALLQTGTLVLLTTALFFILLPLLLLSVGGMLTVAFLDMRKSGKKLKRIIGEKRVYVFFAIGGFGASNALALSQGEELICIAVSPYWISSEGAVSRRFYLNLRRESPNFFTIRRYFYFYVRKKILSSDQTVLIY